MRVQDTFPGVRSLRPVVLACLLCINTPLLGQSFIEEQLPHPLTTARDTDLIEGNADVLHVVGISDTSWSTGFDFYAGYSRPFYSMRSIGPVWQYSALPDTGEFYTGPFYINSHTFEHHVSVDADDTVTVVWSRQQWEREDIPPVIEHAPRVRSVQAYGTHSEILFDIQSGKNPRVATSNNGFTHWVWESITPVPPDTNYSLYTSIVQYRYRTDNGKLSQPQDVGAGFAPQIYADNEGTVHLLWVNANNSAGPYFGLMYSKGFNGVFSPPVGFGDSIRAEYDEFSWRRPVFAFSVDDSGKVYTAWRESRSSPGDSRYFLLTWDGASARVDSSDLQTGTSLPRFAFRSNGEVHAVWGAPLMYSSNISGPLFSQVRVFQSTLGGWGYVQLAPDGTPKAVFDDWPLNSVNYIMDLQNGSDEYFSGPLAGDLGYNDDQSFGPVLTDSQDRTWAVFERGSSSDYALWLANFTDTPNSVSYDPGLPQHTELLQNHPNPFNPSTEIEFQLVEGGLVRLEVLDILGRIVSTVVNEPLSPGSHVRSWNATSFPTGIYFYRLTTTDYSQTKKMVLIK